MKRLSILFYLFAVLSVLYSLATWHDPLGNIFFLGLHEAKQWASVLSRSSVRWLPFSGEQRKLTAKIEYLQQENTALRQYVLSTQVSSELNRFPIIGYSPLDSWQILKIKGGTTDLVEVGQVALDPHGALLGRVIRVHEQTSEIILITNPEHTIDSRIGKSHYRALVSGHFERLEAKRGLWLTQAEFIDKKSDIKVGDEVYTSGLDGLYPPHLFIGTVYAVSEDDMGLFHTAVIIPSAELTTVEEVILIEDTPKS